ncbi:MAG: hypothetical protein ABR559_00305 [Gemmatimonadota bacterium]
MTRRGLVRNFAATDNLEVFLVAAVTAVLGIRLFLYLAGYPAVGGQTLHLAHLLWGGLLMLAAIVLLLAYLGATAERAAAALGGLGFGTFLDEIGKFVTRDNDYFYEPAVALIYATFVGLFLLRHTFRTRQSYTPGEYLVNALRELGEAARHDLDPAEKARAVRYLEQSEFGHPLVAALGPALAGLAPIPLPAPSRFARARARLRALYLWSVRVPGFERLLTAFFIFQLLVKLAYGVVLVLLVGFGWEQILTVRLVGRLVGRLQNLSVAGWTELLASGLAGVFVLFGVLRIRRSRLAAYLMFERAILTSLLLVQVFGFYREQFAALVELTFNLVILAALKYGVGVERERARLV